MKRLKEILAGQFGLSDEWIEGTYLYHLTRVKEAFSVGTMTLEDFEEVDEDFLEEVYEAILPVFQDMQDKINKYERALAALGDPYGKHILDAIEKDWDWE